MEPHPGERWGSEALGKVCTTLEGASLRWMMGKKYWRKEGWNGGSFTRPSLLLAAPSKVCYLLPPYIVTLSPWHFSAPASWQPRHAHTSGFLSLSSPAPPLALASWKDPGSGRSALKELEGGRDNRLPFGELPVVTMHQAPSPITTPTLGQVSSPKATVPGLLFTADPPLGGTRFSVPPDGGRSRCQGPDLQEMLGIWILLLALWL